MSNNNEVIREVEVDGKVIESVIYDKLLPALEDIQKNHAILAMLTMTVLLMKPEITLDELQSTVMGVSGYIVTAITTPSGSDTALVN